MVATTRRKSKITKKNAAEESEHIEEGKPSIQKLQDLQDELDEVKDEANEKILKLEHKYKEKWRSVYHKRKKLITSIPDFWLTAFLNHPGLGDLITEDDRKVFKYLKSLDVEEFKNVKSTYSITFNFSPNPYFEDANLSKTFSFSDEGMATKITGTKIKWKEGMDIANGVNREKKGSKRPFVEESFFTWFNEAQQEFPEGIHDEVAEIIKGDLWPNPLKYFNNVSDEDGSEGEEEDEKDSDGEKNGDEEFEVDGDGEKNLDNHISTSLDVGTDLVQSHENELSLTVDVGHVFQTDLVFDSRDHIIQWCQEVGKQNKIVIVIIKSQKPIAGKKARLTLGCERGGFFRNHKKKSEQLKEKPRQRKRATGTKKCGCPFALKGVWSPGDKWKLEVQCGRHNHELAVGNSYVGRLKEDERQLLIEMTKSGLRPRQVLKTIKQTREGNMSTMRTIYNARSRLRLGDMERRSAMQQVMKLLSEHHYVEWHRMDTETNEVKDILWAHPESLQLAKCFPSVLLVDCTYKTKRYRMPLFEIVGVTSTCKTFTVAFGIMEAETEAHYSWALSCLRTIYDAESLPSVFVTEKESALIRGISDIFPQASQLLCTYHISKDVASNCKKHFQNSEELDIFLKEWNEITQAKTHIDFYDGFAEFERKWVNYPACLRYLRETWLEQKEHFVSSWTSEVKHFGYTTTNRAKKAHSELKQHLRSSKRNYTSCWMAMHRMIIGEIIAVKASFEKTLSTLQPSYSSPAFNELRGLVSHHALDLLVMELSWDIEVDIDGSDCRCAISFTHGLPCVHKIVGFAQEGRPIPLSEIDPHWRTLTAIPTTKRHSDSDYLPDWDLFKQKWETSTEEERQGMWRKLKHIVTPTLIMTEEPSPFDCLEDQIVEPTLDATEKSSDCGSLEEQTTQNPVDSDHMEDQIVTSVLTTAEEPSSCVALDVVIPNSTKVPEPDDCKHTEDPTVTLTLSIAEEPSNLVHVEDKMITPTDSDASTR
ncbi:uncharacterized protein LOC113297758 isoform X2 [Papaver somniferum]|uniref:uncharacterized protein LOC113297758 isoform X2 n=1 Tax=Papaver somniferum TaxID=3469 RepID=UPI000E6F5534|nr:uncharacterized protein LOC113297758 isoform X2 [Papaver somniferum]